MQHPETQPELPLSDRPNIWALGIMFGFVGILAIICAFLAMDKRRNAQIGTLEAFAENTAAGDRAWVDLGAFAGAEGQPRININGTQVPIVPAPKVTIKDSRMLRVARDETSRISIYRTDQSNLKGQRLKGAGDNSPIYFVKVETNKYVQARY